MYNRTLLVERNKNDTILKDRQIINNSISKELE